MRRLLSTSLAVGVLSFALVGLPVVTPATASPVPVPPTVVSVPLTGVDRVALRSLEPSPSDEAGPHDEAGPPDGAEPHVHAPAPAAPPALLSPPRGTAPFALVGVTWTPDDAVGDLAVAVRFRSDGQWSDWEPLHRQLDEGPDDDSPDTDPAGRADGAALRDGTSPLWTGPADGVQARLDVLSGAAPRDVRIELVDPGTSPADALPEAPRSSASAGAPQPAIITRAQWGADERIRRGSPAYLRTVKVGFVHHTASSNDYTADQAAAAVRGIYAYHVQSNGWSDIGYNFLVDRYGRAYEGRFGGIDRYVAGAHTGGFNTDSFGVALLGDFSTVPPSPATMSTLSKVLAHKLGSAHRDPVGKAVLTSAGGGTSRYPAGQAVTFDVVSGHRDAGHTACPGATTYARLGDLRRSVTADLGAAFVEPQVLGATTVPRGSRGPVELRARTLGDVTWTVTAVDAAGAAVLTWAGRTQDDVLSVSWDLRDAAGDPLRPGTYALRLAGAQGSDPAHPVVVPVVVEGRSCAGTPMARAVCKARQQLADRPTTS